MEDKMEVEDNAKRLKRLVDNLANSGLNDLDPADLKAIKKICKADKDAIPFIYDLLMKHLKRKHSQVRLSCFQLTNEIFQRSHAFRELIVHDLHTLIDLVMETNPCQPLPLPKESRDRLKTLSLEIIKEWVQKFGSGYKKLNLAFNYLKQVRKVDFNDMNARSDLEIRQEEEKKRKMDNIWRERVKKVKVEMEDKRNDIQDCLVQMDNCFNLLVPNPENFEFDENDAEDEVTDEEDDEAMRRVHGVVNTQETIAIEIKEESNIIEETKDNSVVIENLKDQCTLLRNNFLPLVRKWSVILTKAGDSGDSDTLKKIIDIKQLLEEAEKKANSFDIATKSKTENEDEDDSDDDDDFVEVQEKSGYEANAFATALNWNDPVPSTSGISKAELDKIQNKPPKKEEDKKTVPIIEYDPEAKPMKVLVDSEKLRFWGSGGLEDGEMIVPGSNSNERSIEFVGKFEPVKWSCRAPLPSGRLCPRHDRIKCPIHGKVVPRDNMGQPTELKDRLAEQEAKEKRQAENPDWQDPELLRDIKAATGVDLKMPKKGQKRKRKMDEKYPGLKAIQSEENTTRKRLQKKLFNRSTMRKVAQSLNKADALRHKNKFSDQFNYLFTK